MKKYIRVISTVCIFLCILIWLNPLYSINQLIPQQTPVWILQNELNRQEDFHQLIDLQNFSYLIAQPKCAQNISALFLVHTAPKNFERRSRIRHTWGQNIFFNNTPFHLIFLLGSVRNLTLQQKLQQENAVFHDIVQGNFIDDYRNMTYKHMMAYKWLIYHCSQAQILIKLDDDTLVNTPQLIKYMEPKHEVLPVFSRKKIFNPARQLFHHPQNLILCQKWLWVRAPRSYRSKWRIDKKEYRKRFYPPYCVGFAIIYSTDVVFSLYRRQQTMQYFWVDDLRLTGMIAKSLNYPLTNMLPHVLSKSDVGRILDNNKNLFDVEFIFAYYNIPKDEFMKLWQLIWLHYELHTNKD